MKLLLCSACASVLGFCLVNPPDVERVPEAAVTVFASPPAAPLSVPVAVAADKPGAWMWEENRTALDAAPVKTGRVVKQRSVFYAVPKQKGQVRSQITVP